MILRVTRAVRVTYLIDTGEAGLDHVLRDEEEDPMGMLIDAHLQDKNDVYDYHYEIVENTITPEE